MEMFRNVCLFGAFALALMAGLVPAFDRPDLADRWEFEVFATGLPRVDNLAVAADGSIYATLEIEGAEGRLVQVNVDGHTTLLDNLDNPDGLLFANGRLYVTEEVEGGRVISFDPGTGRVVPIAWLRKPEGIAMRADGRLVVSEDLEVGGRVLHLMGGGLTSTILGGLRKPEGVAVSADDEIYVAESDRGRILAISDSRTVQVVEGLQAPDQIAISDDGALWIAEDSEEGRILRFADGRIESIASGLDSPQGLAFGADGWLYIAEQGRDRIIRLRPAT